jgi:nucleotide-binding universal stress UspA family protein
MEDKAPLGVPGSVVVGVDGSAGSDAAVVWAARDAVAHRRPLTVVHGTGDPLAVASLGFSYDMPSLLDSWRAAGQEVVEDAVRLAVATSPDVEVTTHLALVDPRAALAEVTARAWLLVVGARGHGRIIDLPLGSVSAAVVARPSCRVVVVRPEAESPDRSTRPVVVGVDGTPLSDDPLTYAFQTASWQHRRLEALLALGVSRSFTFDDLLTHTEVRRLRVDAEIRAAETLAGYREKFPDVVVETIVSYDTPAQALRLASETAAMVVVGSHRRGWLTSRLLGSVSRSLVEHAHCTTVVVPVGGS